jgi:hypothetical protein
MNGTCRPCGARDFPNSCRTLNKKQSTIECCCLLAHSSSCLFMGNKGIIDNAFYDIPSLTFLLCFLAPLKLSRLFCVFFFWLEESTQSYPPLFMIILLTRDCDCFDGELSKWNVWKNVGGVAIIAREVSTTICSLPRQQLHL